MNWEKLSVLEFEGAVKESEGVCLFPIGCLEKHGNHLPLGTDILIAREIADRAARIEPFMVFPFYPLGVVAEVKHKLGNGHGGKYCVFTVFCTGYGREKAGLYRVCV